MIEGEFLSTVPADAGTVPETRFGVWFQRTHVWQRYVVAEAVEELRSLLPPGNRRFNTVIDLGCGEGVAFGLLRETFGAARLIAIDADQSSINRAATVAATMDGPIELRLANAQRLPIATGSIDMVFCHQLLHHAFEPASILRECHRVLAPGGWLLVADSCRSFLEWWPVRLFFRHPSRAQQTAEEFAAMVAMAGFHVDRSQWITPAPWWSRRDLGLLELFRRKPGTIEATQVRIAVQR